MALLSACLDWQRLSQNNPTSILEQDMYKIPLRDWIMMDEGNIKELQGCNESVKLLAKVWRKFKELLIPDGSPLMRLAAHPKFLET